MSEWGQRRAWRNARQAVEAGGSRRAEIENFDKVLGAIRSSLARVISPDGEKRPSSLSPRRIPNQTRRSD